MRKIINSIVDYLFLILTIVTCNTVYMNFADGNLNRVLILIYILVLLLGIILHKVKRKAVSSFLKFIFLYLVFMLPFLLLNNIDAFLFEFICYFFILLPLIVFYFLNIDFEYIKKLINYFKNIIIVLAIISIFFYILTNMNLIRNYDFVLLKWNNIERIQSVFNFYFMPQTELRNSMFFTEPAMYSIFLVLALAIERCFNNNKLNKLVLLFAILTTRSTNGIILGIIILLYDYICLHKKNIFIIITPLILIFAGFMIFSIFSEKILTLSYKTRIDDYIACIKAWKDYPLFGSGFMNSNHIRSYMSYFRRSNLGLSNSLFVVLAQGGLYFLSIYLVPLFFMIKNSKKTKFQLIIVIFFILLCTTIFHYTIFALTIVGMGISFMFKEKTRNNLNGLEGM